MGSPTSSSAAGDSNVAPMSRRLQETWRWLALFAVPAVYVATTAWVAQEVRPLWMGGSVDPTYAYVLNALLVAEGRPPAQATHPGTPLQMMGGAVLHAAHALSGSPLNLRQHVLTDPEYFVDAWRWVLVGVVALASVAQGRAARQLSGSLLCAMAAQAAPLASVWAVRSSILVMCEALVLAAGFAAAALIMRSLRRAPGQPSSREAVLLGLLLGFAIATKVMYASLALLPLIWLPRARHRIVFAGALSASFALGVAPIGPRLPALAVWLFQTLVHTGAWGAGPSGFVALQTYPAVVAAVLQGEPLIHGITALMAMAAAGCRSRDPAADATRRCAWALVAAATLSVLVAAKQSAATLTGLLAAPQSAPVTYYNMPTVSLAGLALTLAYRLFSWSAPASRLPRALLALLLATSLGYQAWWHRRFIDRRRPVRPGAVEAARSATAIGGERVLHGYCVSTLGSALTFANEWSGRGFSDDLRRMYPRTASYDWAGLHLFGRPLTVPELDGLLVDGSSFVLWDTAVWPYESWEWFRGAIVRPLATHGRDRLLRATLVPVEENTAPSAAPLFAGLLILTGSSDRPNLGPPRTSDLEPLGPVTHLALLGTGGPARLVVECRYVRAGRQTLRFEVEGQAIDRRELVPSEGWQQFTVALPPRPGLIALDIEYDRLFENADAARPRFPGYADAARDIRWPAVRYRKLQVWLAGGGSTR
jgi:hypothetical protein